MRAVVARWGRRPFRFTVLACLQSVVLTAAIVCMLFQSHGAQRLLQTLK